MKVNTLFCSNRKTHWMQPTPQPPSPTASSPLELSAVLSKGFGVPCPQQLPSA